MYKIGVIVFVFLLMAQCKLPSKNVEIKNAEALEKYSCISTKQMQVLKDQAKQKKLKYVIIKEVLVNEKNCVGLIEYEVKTYFNSAGINYYALIQNNAIYIASEKDSVLNKSIVDKIQKDNPDSFSADQWQGIKHQFTIGWTVWGNFSY